MRRTRLYIIWLLFFLECRPAISEPKKSKFETWKARKLGLIQEENRRTIESFYSNIKNSTIQVIVHNLDPYTNYNPKTSKLRGFLGGIWTSLEEVLQFRSNITLAEDFDEGKDMIKRQEGDVFLAALVYTSQTTNMHFSQPYFRNWYHLYFKLPEGKPARYLHFEAFHAKLWTYLVLLFILLTIMLWLTCLILRKLALRAEVMLSIPTYFLGVTSAFLNTGYDLKLRSYSARLQISLALFLGVLCYYALNASLVANLAILDNPMPFSSLSKMVDQRSYSLCIRNVSFVYNNFTDSNYTLLPKWRPIVNKETCPDMFDWRNIPKSICENQVAILENRIIMGLVLQRVNCSLTLLPKKYFAAGNHIAIAKKFKEKKALSTMMSRIWSTGVARKLEFRYVKSEMPKFSGTNGPSQIGFSHIQGLLQIYAVLIAASLVLLALETGLAKLTAKKPGP